MNMSIGDIMIPFLALELLGAAFAILLSVSYRFLAVKGDPKLELFMSILPGSNCGACGHAGCLGYAETLVKEGAEPDGLSCGGTGSRREAGRGDGRWPWRPRRNSWPSSPAGPAGRSRR